MDFKRFEEKPFVGFDLLTKPWWEDIPEYVTPEGCFSIEKDFLTLKEGYKEILFSLPCIKTGFLSVDVESQGESEVYIVFDEILNDGK